MLTIALTGGIGSGKTTVSETFKEKNIPIIDTDIIARNLVDIDKPAYKQVIENFGTEIINADKSIARDTLRAIIFSSDEKRMQLEQILHPLIWQEVAEQLSSLDAAYAIVVIPLLFETLDKIKNKQTKDKRKIEIKKVKFDRILVIDLPEKEQIKRVQMRDKNNESTIKNILNSQVSAQTRIEGADDIIFNTFDKGQLKIEVEKLHQKYLSLSK